MTENIKTTMDIEKIKKASDVIHEYTDSSIIMGTVTVTTDEGQSTELVASIDIHSREALYRMAEQLIKSMAEATDVTFEEALSSISGYHLLSLAMED